MSKCDGLELDLGAPCDELDRLLADEERPRGAIVTRTKFREGARLTLVAHDERRPITLGLDDETATCSRGLLPDCVLAPRREPG